MEPTEQITEVQEIADMECRTVAFPPGRDSWLSPERVAYISKFAEMLFFIIGIPWLLIRFFTKPLDTMRIVGAAQAGG